jgi:hypothetical protein
LNHGWRRQDGIGIQNRGRLRTYCHSGRADALRFDASGLHANGTRADGQRKTGLPRRQGLGRAVNRKEQGQRRSGQQRDIHFRFHLFKSKRKMRSCWLGLARFVSCESRFARTFLSHRLTFREEQALCVPWFVPRKGFLFGPKWPFRCLAGANCGGAGLIRAFRMIRFGRRCEG